MSKVKTNQDYLARLVELSTLINPHHGDRGLKSLNSHSAKRGLVHPISDDAGKNIENIRVKLNEGKSVSKVELNLVRSALDSWVKSRQRNNFAAKVGFHAVVGLLTVGLFHIGYLVAKLFNKSLATDPSKEIFSVFRSYKVMVMAEKFLKDTKNFKVKQPKTSFNTVQQALEVDSKSMSHFPIMDGLDDILSGLSQEPEDSKNNLESAKEGRKTDSEEEMDDAELSFSFNPYL